MTRQIYEKEEYMMTLDNVLLEASCLNATKEVETCLKEGANPNARGILQTPLLNAVRNGNYDMVKLLIEAGANVKDEVYGTTPLIEAILFGYKIETKERYITSYFDDEYLAVFELLLENGGDLRTTDGDGKSALYHIVEKGLYSKLKDEILKYDDVTKQDIDNVYLLMDEYKRNDMRFIGQLRER